MSGEAFKQLIGLISAASLAVRRLKTSVLSNWDYI
jgi:hypothetical protein